MSVLFFYFVVLFVVSMFRTITADISNIYTVVFINPEITIYYKNNFYLYSLSTDLGSEGGPSTYSPAEEGPEE